MIENSDHIGTVSDQYESACDSPNDVLISTHMDTSRTYSIFLLREFCYATCSYICDIIHIFIYTYARIYMHAETNEFTKIIYVNN